MESSDTGFPGFVATRLRHPMAFCMVSVPFGIIAVWANEDWSPEIGTFLFATPEAIAGIFLPYLVIRVVSRVGGLESYLTALVGAALAGVAALNLIGTGKGYLYAVRVYTIDLSIWFVAGLGALAGAICYWLELKFEAQEIDL